MIGYDDAINSTLQRPCRIPAMQYTLQNNRQPRVLAQEAQVTPCERPVGKQRQPKLNRRCGILLRQLNELSLENWIAQIIGQALSKKEGQISVVQIPFSPPQHGRVKRHDD